MYGNGVVVEERSSAIGTVLPLLMLFLALAAATVWYVAVPMFDGPAVAKRSCEVIVLESGSPACVREPARARSAQTAAKQTAS
jgi:hypothetical protein